MILIKIFDKNMDTLTTFTEVDFVNLYYRRSLGYIGECIFTLRLDREKVTSENLEMYNRVQIIEDSGKKFLGVITRKDVELNIVNVRCREILYILKKRILGNSYTANGAVSQEVGNLISYVNSVNDTGIVVGDVNSAILGVNNTWKYGNAFNCLDDICKATGNKFEVDPEGKLNVKPILGKDLSKKVILRYNFNQISSSNILKFAVEDDGDDIITTAYGKSKSNTSVQNNSSFVSKYGILEKFKDFRVVNNSNVLDAFTSAELSDRLYSPRINLSPVASDTFEVGDIVRVVLKNSLIDIDDSFQILEKSVEYDRGQKTISVRINTLPKNIVEILSDRDRRLELIEKEL